MSSKRTPEPVVLKGWRVDTEAQPTAMLTFTASDRGRVRIAVSEGRLRTREYDLPPEIRDLAALLAWAQRNRP